MLLTNLKAPYVNVLILFVSDLLELLQTILKTFRPLFIVLRIRKELLGLFPICWSITSQYNTQ